MSRLTALPAEHPPFAAMPIRQITVDTAKDTIAVHIAGAFDSKRLPILCVPGYQRNMTDFAEFVGYAQRLLGADWPIVVLDLRGRGRSSDRADKTTYSSIRDARDIAVVADALAIGRAIMLGQGYGGQVLMALAAQRPTLFAGTVLLDAGPVTDSRGLVRLRNNLQHIESSRGDRALRLAFRQILGADYPGATEEQLDALALRTHAIDKRGRAKPLFDKHLSKQLEAFDLDDVLVAQWPLYEALGNAPLLLLRTQLTDQLRRETFDEMARRRKDAAILTIAGQGSPALLNGADEIAAIARFVTEIARER